MHLLALFQFPKEIAIQSNYLFLDCIIHTLSLSLYSCEFVGKKTLISVPSKLSSSVAYPFALVKPCGGHGDLTLNDINQRIHAPPRSKLKHKVDADGGPYTTSAFSGKPVVGRTKIRTEGGRGSITIMRTRG